MAREFSSAELMAAIMDLRDATGAGLSTMDRRIETLKHEMNRRFDSVDQRFDTIDRRLNAFERSVDQRFDAVDLRFDVVDRRLNALEHLA